MFVGAVARNRDVSEELVRASYGEGRVVGAEEALRLGMVDGIATLDEEIWGVQVMLSAGQSQGWSRAEELDYRRRRLRAASRY